MATQCGNSVCCVGVVHVDSCAVHSGEEMATMAEPNLPALLHCKFAIHLHACTKSVMACFRCVPLG